MRNGASLWSYNEVSYVTFRPLSEQYIKKHVASVGDKILTSVGAYQIEGEGAQLFDKIEGDFFSIMGLPLLPLLNQLRQLKLLET